MTGRSTAEDTLRLEFAAVSYQGRRQSNQDAMGCEFASKLACFVVSDGAGGHEGGEIASDIVVKSVLSGFVNDPSLAAPNVAGYVYRASAYVAQHKKNDSRLREMSATVAVVIINTQHPQCMFAHLGDTRVYLFRRACIQHITRDHRLVQQFIDAGYWNQEQLKRHPQRNVLFAAIGAEGDTEPAITPHPLHMTDGDAILICTDGFWEWLSESEMEASLAMAATVHDWLDAMSQIAEKYGNAAAKPNDNFTAYAIWLGEPSLVTIQR